MYVYLCLEILVSVCRLSYQIKVLRTGSLCPLKYHWPTIAVKRLCVVSVRVNQVPEINDFFFRFQRRRDTGSKRETHFWFNEEFIDATNERDVALYRVHSKQQ